MIDRIVGWIDERTGIRSSLGYLLDRKIPKGVNWWYTLGFATLFVFILQVVSGSFLAMYYSASPDHAFDSVEYINNEVVFGRVVRGIHHWGASAMVALVFLHMLRVLVMGAYKYPRELTWIIGVVLFLLTLGFGFTGYLLPWDEKAYWATTVGTNMAGTLPMVGDYLLKIIRGGADLGAVTLTRFYAIHVLVLPGAIVMFIALHMYLVVKHGISYPPEIVDTCPPYTAPTLKAPSTLGRRRGSQ